MDNTNNSQLKIISANVNSIVTNERRHNLLKLLQEENPDIALLNETKLKHFHRPKFKEYDILRNDRKSANGGGVALLIKKNIKYEQIAVSPHFEILETVVVRIGLRSDKSLFIISVYAPGIKANEFINELSELFSTLTLDNTNNYYMLAGDLNAKHTIWNNSYYNGRGLALANWVADREIDLRLSLRGNNIPTFPRSNAFLDIAILDSRLKLNNLNSEDTLQTIDIDSDHRAIEIQFSLPHLNDQIALEIPQITLNYNKTNWEDFQKFVSENDNLNIPHNRNLSSAEIDEYLEKINYFIKNAIHITVPRFEGINSTEVYINGKIKDLLKTKSRLITILNNEFRHPSSLASTIIVRTKSCIKKCKIEIKKEFQKSVNKYWENKIKKIPINSSNMFPQINSIFRPKETTALPNLTIKMNNTSILAKANTRNNSKKIKMVIIL